MRNYIQIVESATIAQQAMSRPGFAEWFRGSKVVDQNGLPVICHHGTFEDFLSFNHQNGKRYSYGFNRLGYWFDTDPRTPEWLAGYEKNQELETGSVYPCYLSIRKPFVLDSELLWHEDQDKVRKLAARMKELGTKFRQSRPDASGYGSYLPDGTPFNPQEYHKARDEFKKFHADLGKNNSHRIDGFNRLMNMLPNGAKSKDEDVIAFQEELISEGHDGIYLIDTIADFGARDYETTNWWIAFHPHQIKSVFAKNFNGNSNDITD
jgi:hypothetical protein